MKKGISIAIICICSVVIIACTIGIINNTRKKNNVNLTPYVETEETVTEELTTAASLEYYDYENDLLTTTIEFGEVAYLDRTEEFEDWERLKEGVVPRASALAETVFNYHGYTDDYFNSISGFIAEPSKLFVPDENVATRVCNAFENHSVDCTLEEIVMYHVLVKRKVENYYLGSTAGFVKVKISKNGEEEAIRYIPISSTFTFDTQTGTTELLSFNFEYFLTRVNRLYYLNDGLTANIYGILDEVWSD